MNKPNAQIQKATAYEPIRLIARGVWVRFETDGKAALMTKSTGERQSMDHREAEGRIAHLLLEGWLDYQSAN